MNLVVFLILSVLIVIIIVVGFLIEETKQRLCYYACVGLGCFVIMNMYLGITYYISLRNDPGVQGQQGNKGPQGIVGQPGKCTYADQCGIPNARTLILNTASKMYDIPDTCLDTPTLQTCGSQTILDEAIPINNQINMLEQIAYSTTMAQTDFTEKLNVCLKDSNSCMDPTDF